MIDILVEENLLDDVGEVSGVDLEVYILWVKLWEIFEKEGSIIFIMDFSYLIGGVSD